MYRVCIRSPLICSRVGDTSETVHVESYASAPDTTPAVIPASIACTAAPASRPAVMNIRGKKTDFIVSPQKPWLVPDRSALMIKYKRSEIRTAVRSKKGRTVDRKIIDATEEVLINHQNLTDASPRDIPTRGPPHYNCYSSLSLVNGTTDIFSFVDPLLPPQPSASPKEYQHELMNNSFVLSGTPHSNQHCNLCDKCIISGRISLVLHSIPSPTVLATLRQGSRMRATLPDLEDLADVKHRKMLGVQVID